MKKRFLAAAIATGLAATTMTAQAEVKVKWFGFAQITAEQGEGAALKEGLPRDDDGVVFGTDRVRFGFKVKDGNFFGKLQADLQKTDSGIKLAGIPEIIKDIIVGYKFSDAAKVSMGVFKTPVGMDFNTSGKKLDITKRGMEKGLVLERAAGVMLSGRKIGGGFGYDVFYGNPATRGKGTPGGRSGDANTTALRVSYDMGKMMHVELSYGVDGASVAGAEDYEVVDFGFKFKSGPSTAKFEYIDGTGVKGVNGADENVWFAHYGHMLGKKAEVTFRYYLGTQSLAGGGPDLDLSNTYLGVNFYTGSNKTNGRIQLNYVISGGDDANATTTYSGIGRSYIEDAFLMQYQVSF